MHELNISVSSFRQVQEFVALAMVQPFEVLVGNDKQQVNGKSFMGMFTLDYRRPLCVRIKCTDEEYGRFCRDAAQFLV